MIDIREHQYVTNLLLNLLQQVIIGNASLMERNIIILARLAMHETNESLIGYLA